MADRVIWERTVDQDKIRERTERFRKRFFPPAALILLAVLIFSSWQNAVGVLFLLGLVGLTWGTTVRFQSLSDAANPTMTVGNGRLKLGNRTVIIEDVKRFTTIATAMQTSVLGSRSQIKLGKALFRMDLPGTRSEPDLIEFGWPNMEADAVETVRAALELELAGKWVEPADLVERKDIPQRGRRSRFGRRRR